MATAAGDQNTAAVGSAELSAGAASTCVVVDDHDELLRAIVSALENEGYVVVGEAPTGETAVAVIESTQPGFAVVDLELPDMTGVELAARILHVASETAPVLHSAWIEPSQVAEALAAGVRAVVVKGSVERLAEALRAVARGELYLDPTLARQVDACEHCS
jgi:DNA-binding NarL/FixJ family response regulator